MCEIYKAPIEWNPKELNPFTPMGDYGKEWSAFIYDEEIQHYSNIYNGTMVYVLRVNPDIEYIPGVRLYFDAEAIIKDGLGTRDGLHILKVKDKLPLDKYLLEWVSAESFQKEYFEQQYKMYTDEKPDFN